MFYLTTEAVTEDEYMTDSQADHQPMETQNNVYEQLQLQDIERM